MTRFAKQAAFVLAGLVAACGSAADAVRSSSVRLERLDVTRAIDVLDFRPGAGPEWLDDSTLVMIDRDERQIVAIDLESGATRRGGGRGAGPGEFESGPSLAALGNGGVAVLDMTLKRLSVFDAGLRFVVAQPVSGIPLSIVDATDSAARVLWLSFGAAGPRPRTGRIDFATGEVSGVHELFVDSGLAVPESVGPFEPMFFSAVADGNGGMVAGIASSYRLVIFDETGVPAGSFGRPDIERAPPSDDQIASRRDAAARAESRRGPPPAPLAAGREAALRRPDGFFVPNAFSVDAAGRLWVVTTRQRDGMTEIDVFGPDRTFVETVAVRDAVQAMAFRGDRVAVLVTRTAAAVEGYDGIDLYRIGAAAR